MCLHFLEFLFLRSIHYTSVQFEPRPKRERKLFLVVQMVFWWKALKKIDNGAQLKPTQQRKKAIRMSTLLSFSLSSCLHLLFISTFMQRRKKGLASYITFLRIHRILLTLFWKCIMQPWIFKWIHFKRVMFWTIVLLTW